MKKSCQNCYTSFSPQWRKGYCNACSIYYKRNGVFKQLESLDFYANILIDLKNNNNKIYIK